MLFHQHREKKIISLINIPGLALLSLSVEAISRSQNISLTTFHCQGDAEPGLQIPAAEPPAQSHPSIPLNPLAQEHTAGVKTPWLIHSHAAVSISSHLQYICTNGEAFPFLQRVCEAQGRFPAKSFPKEISLNAGGRNKGQMKPRSRTLPDPSPHRQSRMETIQSSGSKINSLIFSPSAVLSVKTEWEQKLLMKCPKPSSAPCRVQDLNALGHPWDLVLSPPQKPWV